MTSKGLISIKQFTIKEKIQVSLRGENSQHHTDQTFIKDCHRQVTPIILKAAEDCCRNGDRQKRADREALLY